MSRPSVVPEGLELLGRRTWALPGWLERRLPRVAIEPEPAAPRPRAPIPALEGAT